MLEPVRQYAREKREESGETEWVRRRHLSFFLALAEEAEPRLRSPEDVEWLESLEADHDNLREGLSWALERGKGHLAVRLCGALGGFWLTQGNLGEGREWLEAADRKSTRLNSSHP